MRTCGMMGEVVGRAASICVKENCTPREVYSLHFDELKELMNLPAGRVDRRSTSPWTPTRRCRRFRCIPRRRSGRRPSKAETAQGAIDPKKLPGIVVDDTEAKLEGSWTHGSGTPGFIGAGYIYDGGKNKGSMSARFEFIVPTAGKYEVRFAYSHTRTARVACR